MALQVHYPAVLNNLIQFRAIIDGRSETKHPAVYQAFLHKHTGKIYFLDQEKKKPQHPSDWKRIEIVVLHPAFNKIHFEIHHLEDPLPESLMVSALAKRIAKETVDILNLKAKKMAGSAVTEREILKDVESIEVIQRLDFVDSIPGWVGTRSRKEAENLLKGKSYTYLIRDADSVAQSCMLQVAESNHEPMQPYLLMIIDKDQRIIERMIVYTSRGWILYLDEPCLLNYRFYDTIKALLSNLEAMGCRPIG